MNLGQFKEINGETLLENVCKNYNTKKNGKHLVTMIMMKTLKMKFCSKKQSH